MKIWVAMLAGCALTSKSAPIELRYFTPPARAVAHTAASERTPLRLGRVTFGALAGTRILHADSDVEVVPYETLRWSEEPDAFVRRALERALYDGQPLDQATDGSARTLEIDVLAFQEVRIGARRIGRVELSYDVRDDTHVIAHGVARAERDAGTGIEGVVTAIGEALDAAAADVAARVTAAVRR